MTTPEGLEALRFFFKFLRGWVYRVYIFPLCFFRKMIGQREQILQTILGKS